MWAMKQVWIESKQAVLPLMWERPGLADFCSPMIHFSVRAQATHYASDVDSKILSARSEVAYSHPPGQREEGGTLSSQIQSPMSEGSYQEEPSPVPEPTLPEDFHMEEEQYRDLENRGYDLRAELGEEEFVDRREETVAVVSHKLSREETPEREVSFKVTLEDYSPSRAPQGFLIPGKEEEEEEEKQGLPGEMPQEGTAI